VKNIAIDRYRKQKRRPETNLEEYTEFLADDQADPESTLLRKESHQEMLAGISRLNPSYVDVLTLKVAFEYSDQEIAHLLGLTPANVRVRLHRARQHLGMDLVKEDA
jgi:RNA polymerase sigma-70 factor (ECF subfamily)